MPLKKLNVFHRVIKKNQNKNFIKKHTMDIVLVKGQLISDSECLFGNLKFSKTNEKFDKFLP
jgi:hypothetical protein